MPSSDLRLAIWLLAACAVLAAGCSRERSGVALPSAPPAAVPRAQEPGTSDEPVVAAASPTMGRGLRLSGTLEAHQTSTLTAQVTAPIAEVHVREGDRVAKGDPLVTFDMSTVELMAAQARAGVGQARAGLRTAKAAQKVVQAQADAVETEAKRAQKLLEDKAIPSSQVDRVVAQLTAARAGVEQAGAGMGQAQAGIATAEAGLALAEDQLRHEVARAPFDGIVLQRHTAAGEYATAMPPKLLVTLQDVSVLDLRLQVPSVDMLRVTEGTRVSVYLPPLEERISGSVSRVVPAVNPMTRSFSAIVELPNTDGALRPGMFAEVEVLGPPLAEPVAPSGSSPAAAVSSGKAHE